MGAMDTVATSPQGYVDLALRLGSDIAFRERVVSRLLESHHELVRNEEAALEWEAMLLRVGQM